MNHSIRVYFPIILLAICFAISCKQKNLNRYAYDPNRDTIPPVLSITVPVNNDLYAYGEDIHIVGTLTDLESRNKTSQKAGRLQSLYLNLSIVDILADTVIKVIYEKAPNVDGMDGVTINEKTFYNGPGSPIDCRLTGVASDYSGRKDTSIIYFKIN